MGNTCRGKLLKANDRTASTSNADKPSRKEGLAHSVHDDPDLTVKGETGEAVVLEETMDIEQSSGRPDSRFVLARPTHWCL